MLPALLLYASLVNDVRDLIARHELAAAERAARAYRQQSGATPEFAAALSWVARGALAAGQYDQADRYAAKARKTADGLLNGRSPDADPSLLMAVGSAIEVHAQVLAERGERAEAIEYLQGQLAQFHTASLNERIRKNINLLTLVGKPAPPLRWSEWLGPKPPPLAALRGRAVLLFFWAHWCPDCKAEAPVIARLLAAYGPQGLAVIGPTKLYGFAARGEPAPPDKELAYIGEVRRQYYAALAEVPAPVGAANFETYGASTTPTLVLIDRRGIVRYYHPGAVPEAELSARIQAVLKK
jgi:thiol-disulfide isomerase/thioredoxin